MKSKQLAGIVILAVLALIIWQIAKRQQPVATTDTSGWETYASDAYDFFVKYPPTLMAEASLGRSDRDGEFLTLDIGTTAQIAALKAAADGPGAGGPPLYLRVSASRPSNSATSEGGAAQPGSCTDGYVLAEYVTIDGIRVAKCTGSTMNGSGGLLMVFAEGDMRYVVRSDMYVGESVTTIDDIVSTFRVGK